MKEKLKRKGKPERESVTRGVGHSCCPDRTLPAWVTSVHGDITDTGLGSRRKSPPAWPCMPLLIFRSSVLTPNRARSSPTLWASFCLLQTFHVAVLLFSDAGHFYPFLSPLAGPWQKRRRHFIYFVHHWIPSYLNTWFKLYRMCEIKEIDSGEGQYNTWGFFSHHLC